MKSQYDGTVYDVGINASAFSYQSGSNSIRFRPFYLLFIGKHTDVAHYFDQLKANGLPSPNNLLLLSRHIVSPMPQFADASIDSISALVEVSDLILPDSPDRRVRQFRARSDPSSFVTTLRYDRLVYTMPFDSSAINVDTIARKRVTEKDSLAIDPNAQRGFTFRPVKIVRNQLMLKGGLTSNLPGI